jgi:hypothetical protein
MRIPIAFRRVTTVNEAEREEDAREHDEVAEDRPLLLTSARATTAPISAARRTTRRSRTA